jgi:hypothetical protein
MMKITFRMPAWLLACYSPLQRLLSGGWKIIKTVGSKLQRSDFF